MNSCKDVSRPLLLLAVELHRNGCGRQLPSEVMVPIAVAVFLVMGACFQLAIQNRNFTSRWAITFFVAQRPSRLLVFNALNVSCIEPCAVKALRNK